LSPAFGRLAEKGQQQLPDLPERKTLDVIKKDVPQAVS